MKNFYRREKTLLSMSQCLMVMKTKFQHSVTTAFFFARFSVRALSLWLFCKNLIKLRIFGFFSLVRRMSVKKRINLKFLVSLGKTPTEALKLLQEVYGDDTMSRTLRRRKRGGGRWSQEWKAIHKQNRRKCSACERKGAEQLLSYC